MVLEIDVKFWLEMVNNPPMNVGMRKIAPETSGAMGIADNVLTREETKSERARRNWQRARYLVNLEKITMA